METPKLTKEEKAALKKKLADKKQEQIVQK